MREKHIKIPRPKFVNVIGITILVGLVVSGLVIIRNVNQEFALREIAGKFQEYKYAVLSFNNIYSGLPGDITNATFYWKDVTQDGNGNRRIEHSTGESVTAWQQLQLAKVINLPYVLTGKWGGKEGVLLPGENVPSIRDKQTGFFIQYFQDYKGNMIGMGGETDESGLLDKSVLTPIEAYNLDLLIDDGYPDKGSIIAISKDQGGCSLAGEYKKEKDLKECVLLFKI